MSLSNLTLCLLGGVGGPLAPSFAVNGEPLANLWEFGDAYDEVVGSVANPTEFFPRNPQILPLASGTILQFCAKQVTGSPSSADNTAQYIGCQSSIDGGKTYVNQPAAYTVSGFVASNGAGHNAVNQFYAGQLNNGTIVLLVTEQPYLSNTAGTWYDFSGNTPPHTQGVKFYVTLFTESGGVLTVTSGPTEITSQFILLDDRNNMSISAIADNGLGTTTYRITVSGNTDALVTGSYYRLRLAGLSGTNASLLNYSSVGALYAKCIDATHLDIQGVNDTGGNPTLTSATASPEAAWPFLSCGGGCKIASGPNAGYLVIPGYLRCSTNAQGQPTGFAAYTNDGVTFGMTAQTTANTTIGEVEPTCCNMSTGGVRMYMRESSGTLRLTKTLAAGSWTWSSQATVAELTSAATLATAINVGGSNIVTIAPNDSTKRTRLTAWASGDDGATFPNKRVLNWDFSGYSHAALYRGNILFACERDYADETFAGAPGRILLGQTNLAAIKSASFDEVRYYFNDLANGLTAWTGQPGVRDWGAYPNGPCFSHHALVKGSPKYAAGGLTFGTSDYLTLASASQNDSFYATDYISTDSGGFTLEMEFSIASSGTGVLASHGGSGVGSGTKGWSLLISGGGVLQCHVDDGTNNLFTSNLATVNDGGTYRVVATWPGATSVAPTVSVYNATTGAIIEKDTGTSGSVLGGISNVTVDTCLLRYADQAVTGRMNQSITVRMFRFVRGTTAAAILPLPLGALPTPEGFPTAPSGSPGDTSHVPAANQFLYILRTDTNYGNRSRSLAGPGKGRRGDGVVALVDSSPNGFFTTSASLLNPMFVDSDATVGKHFFLPATSTNWPFDSRSLGSTNPSGLSLDTIANFSGSTPWGMGGAIKITSPGTTQQKIFGTWTGTKGFIIVLGYSSTARLGFLSFNAGGESDFEVSPVGGTDNAQYTAGTWYYWALTFSGTGGAGSAGLTAYMIPLTGSALLLSAVTSNKATPRNISGSTTASTGTADSALFWGDVSAGCACRLKKVHIEIGYKPVDADILAWANDAIL